VSVAVSPPEKELMTAEEYLALPDDGTERWLIRGELRPREPATTIRNQIHGEVEASVVFELKLWLREQPEPRGSISCGEAGFRLRRDPDTLVGIDVAYTSAEIRARTAGKPTVYDGPPVLAVEILSPSDKHEDIVEKVGDYLEAGSVVWVVDPDFRNVIVHQPGQEEQLFNARQELSGEPYLPGFRVPVKQLFEG
jgi:Uma2 family endonuclease